MVWMFGVGDGVEGLVESWNGAAILSWSIPFTAGFALPDGGDGELVFPRCLRSRRDGR